MQTNIPTYAKAKYEKVYPGIDLIYYGNQRQLEYDFIVAPGADPKAVRLAFEGADKLAIDKQGDLVVKAVGGDVRLHKPRVYQDINGQQREIEGGYVLHRAKSHSKDQVGFQVVAYDKNKPLVIDPVLVYSTYLGGSGLDSGASIAVDSLGSAYVAGSTTSPDFPVLTPAIQVTHGIQITGVEPDAFVTKLNPAGSALVYSTFLGGSSGDAATSIAVDAIGNAYLTGQTSSTDFPIANPIFPNLNGLLKAFVTKINSTGNALVYSTFLGGSSVEAARDIAVDGVGNAYITGETNSSDFPTTPRAFETSFTGQGVTSGFITKLNSNGQTLVYSTYFNNASITAIAVDASGIVYITGSTNSVNFPTKNALQPNFAGNTNPCCPIPGEAFITKINDAGTDLIYSTYLGGTGDDLGFDIAMDDAGNAYVTGQAGTDFPTTPGAFNTNGFGIFATKLSSDGTKLVYSTFLGSSGNAGRGIAIDTAGDAYITGYVDTSYGTTPNFPIVNPIPNSGGGGHIGFLAQDAFITKLNPSGSDVVYSSLMGGNRSTWGFGIAVDSNGNVYVTGQTISESGFPLVNALQPVYGGAGGQVNSDDAFVAKISDTAPPPPQPVLSVTPASLDFGTVTVGTSKGLEFTVKNTGAGTLAGTATASAPFSIVSGGAFSLAAGASQAVVVRFTPTTASSFSGNLSFTSNGGNISPLVTGTGAAAPAISATPTALNFGSVAVGSSADRSFTIQNTGGGTLTGTCNTAAPFSLPNGCPFNLASSQTADVTVRFSPTATGTFTGNVFISSDAGNLSRSVQGIGQQVAAGRNCGDITFIHPFICPLLNKLRQPAYLNISRSVVSDQQLLPYVRQHQNEINALLAKIDYGRDIKAFLNTSALTLTNDNERQFINYIRKLSNANKLLSFMNSIVQILTLPNDIVALSLVSDFTGVISNTVTVIQIYENVYKRLLRLVTAFDTRNLLNDYFAGRCGGTSSPTSCPEASQYNKDAVWQEFVQTFGDKITPVFVAQRSVTSDARQSAVKTWFENAFVAYRLVGFLDSDQIRSDYGITIVHLATQAPL